MVNQKYFLADLIIRSGRDSSIRRSRFSVIGPFGATFFLGGVLEKMHIYTDKRMAIQVMMQIKDHDQQV